MSLLTLIRWSLGLVIAGLVTVVPFVYYRVEFNFAKRLREVDPGKLYRGGQMTSDGIAAAVARYHLRTIINLQDEYPDPAVYKTYFTTQTIPESEVCRRLGVNYLYMPPELIQRHRIPTERPSTIDRFLAVMDDPNNYPVLIHCRAGLHRTGVMAAVYRMEYQGWSQHEAIQELKTLGFGEYPCSAANDYITQYILTYKPGMRSQP